MQLCAQVCNKFCLTGWDHFVSIKVKSWELFYTDWLTSPGTDTKVVHFENLQDPTTLQWNLLNILDFLGKQLNLYINLNTYL